MKTTRLLCLVLGMWLGGSLILGSVVAYNFAGVEDLFARNPRLADRAGFGVQDESAKKTSLLWVHASELNRVFFENWNRTQLVLGVLSIGLAIFASASRALLLLLTAAVALVAYTHFGVEPEILDLGRRLDFTPRLPPPPELTAFQRYHGLYFGLETLRLLLLAIATLMAVWQPSRPGDRAR
jgi:hypothetical protein